MGGEKRLTWAPHNATDAHVAATGGHLPQDGTAATLYGFDERNSPKGGLMDDTGTGWTLELALVRQAKQALADADAPPATSLPNA